MDKRFRVLAAVALILVVAAVVGFASPARGAPRTFHLYGDFPDGWGETQTSMTNPGPTLTVAPGDNVTIVIHSVDGAIHNWYLDLNGDGTRDASEPFAPDVSSMTPVATPEFPAPGPGTYTYYCQYHQSTMRGSFVVTAPGTPPADNSLLLYAGIGIGIVLVAVVAVLMMRGRGKAPKPPST